MNRYQTLNVSLQTERLRNEQRVSQTIDVSNKGEDDQGEDNNQSDQRVKKFRELYYKNEKLRRQLKTLNAKLNQKLQKIKFPNVKQRAASVDLNRQPPNKALQRELDNAYKQIQMYKQQVQTLKIKEQSSENYARLRDMQNLIGFKDKQIADVQQQLKSIKNIKKAQEKRIQSQLENEQVKERIQSYLKEHKQLKERLKQIAKKSRKRQEQYKKQQAYLVSLAKKYRIATDEKQLNLEEEVSAPVKDQLNKEVNQKQFQEIKAEIANQKKLNDEVLKKAQILKKQINAMKDQNHRKQEKWKEKDALSKTLQTKIIALNRLIREQERKPKDPPKNPLITNIEDLQLKQGDNQSFTEVYSPKQITISKEDLSLKRMLNEMEAGERQWKGKYRKVQHGFGAPGDKKFQFQGNLIGFHVSLDENQMICGVSFIFLDKNGRRQQPFQGKRTNSQLKWELVGNDRIVKLSGSFTQQSYLSEIMIMSNNGNSGIFGKASSQPFSYRINENEKISGCFGSIRQLGNDSRISQIGFWLEKI